MVRSDPHRRPGARHGRGDGLAGEAGTFGNAVLGRVGSSQRPEHQRVRFGARSFLYFSSSGKLALLQRDRSSASWMDSQRS